MWEYLLDFIDDEELEPWLNARGRERWELVHFEHFPSRDLHDGRVLPGTQRLVLKRSLE